MFQLEYAIISDLWIVLSLRVEVKFYQSNNNNNNNKSKRRNKAARWYNKMLPSWSIRSTEAER